MEAVLEGMAEYFSAELSQKVKRGLDVSAQKCQRTGGGLALGYKSVDKKIELDEDTAHIVKTIFQMYVDQHSMAEIVRYLNEKQIKGNQYNKNSLRRILTNKRYMGYYIYGDLEIPDGIPRIIDDDVFKQVQVQMEKNQKAPARSKSLGDNYILTTKLFCGKCGAAMVGYSGVSHTSKQYCYYSCVNQKKRKCKKKSIRKDLIEPIVVQEVKNTLQSKYLESVAKKIAALSRENGNDDMIKYLEKKLKENATALENLVTALEQGKSVDIITSQIEKRQVERDGLEVELAKERIKSPELSEDEILFFFERFKKGIFTIRLIARLWWIFSSLKFCFLKIKMVII